jgi:branched-chain amino acid transport system substrate-binding protein
VIAISSDRALTTTNIPWIFRLPDRTSLEQALGCLSAAGTQAGANRGKIRELLSSGADYAGISFEPTGEQRKPLVTSRQR